MCVRGSDSVCERFISCVCERVIFLLWGVHVLSFESVHTECERCMSWMCGVNILGLTGTHSACEGYTFPTKQYDRHSLTRQQPPAFLKISFSRAHCETKLILQNTFFTILN